MAMPGKPPLRAAAAIAAAALLLLPAAAAAGGRGHHHGHKHHHHGGRHQPPPAPPVVNPSGPAFGSVEILPDGPGRRLVSVETTGPAMSVVEICDLTTPECVDAELDAGRWTARVPAPDPVRYSIGLIGRSGELWVTDSRRSDPPAPIPPPVNIG